MKSMSVLLVGFLTLLTITCKTEEAPVINGDVNIKGIAVVNQVAVSGSEDSYSFSVTITSPDTGCDQYADWWEVVTEQDKLVYRRILAHSHVNEQPFTRSGGGVAITKSDIVIVRGHMNNTGYGESSVKGSVQNGFEPYETPSGFAASLESMEPLPKDCAF